MQSLTLEQICCEASASSLSGRRTEHGEPSSVGSRGEFSCQAIIRCKGESQQSRLSTHLGILEVAALCLAPASSLLSLVSGSGCALSVSSTPLSASPSGRNTFINNQLVEQWHKWQGLKPLCRLEIKQKRNSLLHSLSWGWWKPHEDGTKYGHC